MFYLIKDGKITNSSETKISQDGCVSIKKDFNSEELKKIENGYLYINGEFVESEESIINEKENQKKYIYNIFHETLKQINEKYTEDEQKTFETKRQEAEKMKNDPEYISIFIQNLSTDGEDIQELKDKILENSLNYQLLYASAEKKLREDLKVI